jgi:Tol biopolymer transport system component
LSARGWIFLISPGRKEPARVRDSPSGWAALAILVATGAIGGGLPAFASESEQTTTLVSVSSEEDQGTEWSGFPTASDDGRFVAFVSAAPNLVPGDTNHASDVFVRDRESGKTTRVSVTSSGSQADWESDAPAISADGRFVAFESNASNLGQDNPGTDIYVRDRESGTTIPVSVAVPGVDTWYFSGSNGPSISADGRYVAFYSWARNMTPDDQNWTLDIFLRDLESNSTRLISRPNQGGFGNGPSFGSAISADGDSIAFFSQATNLLHRNSHASTRARIFLWTREEDRIDRVDVLPGGHSPNASPGPPIPSVSADGNLVAFVSKANNLVPWDTNKVRDVFVRNMATGAIRRVTLGYRGQQANRGTWYGDISPSGRYVTFDSSATNLVRNDDDGGPDVFIRDRQLHTTALVSVSIEGGVTGGGGTSMSTDSRFVAFSSGFSDLVQGDANEQEDAFIRGPVS